MAKSLSERFWLKVRKTPTCWFWMASLHPDGYGHCWTGSKIVNAHRVAWELTRGPIPKGLNVLHKCDVPMCVNPSHLYLGTQKDNRRDADVRGRTNLPKGSAHPNAKLSEAQVISLRKEWKPWIYTARMLAQKYGVKKSVIMDILNRKTWKHI
jgi:HNH endonuclease